jgi:ParB-like chromosome segregation protein Spo0J
MDGGQIESIVLRHRRGGGYWLVAGWHRFEAAKKLRWKTIRATVFKRMTAIEAELVEIDSNLRVARLNPAERLLLALRLEELDPRDHPAARAAGLLPSKAMMAKLRGG